MRLNYSRVPATVVGMGLLANMVTAPAFASGPPPSLCAPNTCYYISEQVNHYCGNDWVKVFYNGSHYNAYTQSHGTTHCNDAIWPIPSGLKNRKCKVEAWIPNDGNKVANARAFYGIFDTSTHSITTVGVSQGDPHLHNGFATLGTWSGLDHIYLSDNNGQTNTTIGVSDLVLTCQ